MPSKSTALHRCSTGSTPPRRHRQPNRDHRRPWTRQQPDLRLPDYQYYLTQGDGPWGDLAWTYDLLGNRLSETRDGVTDTYTYVANAAMGNSARLDEIQLGAGGTRSFAYDDAGNQDQVDSTGDVVDRTYDDAGACRARRRTAAGASTDFLYDGRSYLRLASGVAPDTSGTAGVFCDDFESGDTSAWDTGVGPCPPVDVLTTAEPTYKLRGGSPTASPRQGGLGTSSTLTTDPWRNGRQPDRCST